MSVIEREFTLRGRRIAARCWHDPALPPLLALHGWQDNAATFDRLAPLLPGHHIVAMDFAGHGLSDWRAEGMRYHTLDHVDDVLSVVEQLGWQTFRLLGHSMGAGIGVLLAGALPKAFELATQYSAAVSMQAAEPDLAARFVALLAGLDSQALRREGGFEF